MTRFGRHLTEAEVARYDLIEPELARRVRLVPVPFVPGGYRAITIWTVIGFVRMPSAGEESSLLAHELVHVEQWRRHGPARFAARYIGSWLRGLRRHRSFRLAYESIPAEREARELTSDWFRRRQLFPDPLPEPSPDPDQPGV